MPSSQRRWLRSRSLRPPAPRGGRQGAQGGVLGGLVVVVLGRDLAGRLVAAGAQPGHRQQDQDQQEPGDEPDREQVVDPGVPDRRGRVARCRRPDRHPPAEGVRGPHRQPGQQRVQRHRGQHHGRQRPAAQGVVVHVRPGLAALPPHGHGDHQRVDDQGQDQQQVGPEDDPGHLAQPRQAAGRAGAGRLVPAAGGDQGQRDQGDRHQPAEVPAPPLHAQRPGRAHRHHRHRQHHPGQDPPGRDEAAGPAQRLRRGGQAPGDHRDPGGQMGPPQRPGQRLHGLAKPLAVIHHRGH